MPATPDPDGLPHDLPRLIEVLDRHRVDYLVVGGAAAYAYGAQRPTEDVDCVVRRDRENLDRLADALRELHARLRVAGMTDAEARLLPVQIDATTLDMAGMTTWMTDAGPFDVLAGLEAPDGRLVPYEELVARATVLHGAGFAIRAAALEDIVRAKERADRPKDREALPELREIRDARAVDSDRTGL
jgi:predicted nucleotidyltransferase